MCVDLPFTPYSYNEGLANKIDRIKPYDNKNVTSVVCIEDLNAVFGKKWNIVQTKGISTQARIIGLVKVLFRMKFIKIQRHIEPG